MTLSRRELLRLAAGAAATPGIAALAAACGADARSGRVRGPAEVAASLRERLRSLVDELEESYPIATALAISGAAGAAAVDSLEHGASSRRIERVRFEVFDGTRWFSQTVASLDLEVVTSAAARLRSRAPGGRGGERPTREAKARDFERRGEIDVRGPASAWIERARALHELSRGPASSQIIYRGAFVDVSDLDHLFIGAGNDLQQSISRVRAGVVLMSWNGLEILAEEAVRAGTGGLELATLPGGAVSTAARRALTHSAGPPEPKPEVEVVLAPSVVAALIEAGLAQLLDGRAWQSGESRLADFAGDRIGDPLVSLADDPTIPGGYASYDFDDEGWLAAPRPLIHRGVTIGPLTDRRTAAALGRGRTGHARLTAAGMRPRPSNLVMSPGAHTETELIARVKRGYLIEGGLLARCDPGRWNVLVRARRAREIEDGDLTGRVMGPVTVTAAVKSLLLGVRAVGRSLETATTTGGASITAPHLLTRAEVG